ncbi:hypothetical protein K9N68_37670 (plasmid) [Kovacikia minuta CCNUW1]|uniref:hypothetical protein n=1 Tax=Kovacikia minuta TaxID=2931930 RepID=UPI001CCFC2B7|nr:hypothetical protein [Kovacikia minuta]UBF30738.1 hypothetical protein K9N68_37670 [Kovacikia minuta CCNUW1]
MTLDLVFLGARIGGNFVLDFVLGIVDLLFVPVLQIRLVDTQKRKDSRRQKWLQRF